MPGSVSARQSVADGAPTPLSSEQTLGLLRDTSKALAGALSLPDMLNACAEAIVRWLGAAFARVWTLDETLRVLTLQASAGQ
ncbi:MAG: hypothetical protein J2P57_25270, partial [Acidimicrobiaceae bacterium]|nr:hypothetical protein [Acidimicrobiaceae bacterium]